MAQSTSPTVIPIEHHTAVHEIETTEDGPMRPLTLMELVDAVGEVAETEQEVMATVTYMLRSGRVQLANEEDAADIAV